MISPSCVRPDACKGERENARAGESGRGAQVLAEHGPYWVRSTNVDARRSLLAEQLTLVLMR